MSQEASQSRTWGICEVFRAAWKGKMQAMGIFFAFIILRFILAVVTAEGFWSKVIGPYTYWISVNLPATAVAAWLFIGLCWTNLNILRKGQVSGRELFSRGDRVLAYLGKMLIESPLVALPLLPGLFLGKGKLQLTALNQSIQVSFSHPWGELLEGHLAALVIALCLIGFIGTIYLAARFAFSTLLIVDRKLGPIQALKASWYLTRGQTLSLIGFFLLALLFNVAGALCLVVGLLLTLPLTWLAFVAIYLKCSGETLEPADKPAPNEEGETLELEGAA